MGINFGPAGSYGYLAAANRFSRGAKQLNQANQLNQSDKTNVVEKTKNTSDIQIGEDEVPL